MQVNGNMATIRCIARRSGVAFREHVAMIDPTAQNITMNYDKDKVDEVALALLYLTLHDGCRAWKGLDWDIMDRLYEKRMIHDPKGKAKSVVLTEEGLNRCEELFRKFFGTEETGSGA